MDFEGFIEAELAGFTRFAGVLTGDRQLAHDVLIDALLVASLRWADIRSMKYPAAYVRRIVVTTFLADHRKTARRRTAPSGDNDLLDVVQPDATARVENRQLLEGLLRQLPRQQRIAVVLRYYLDYDDASIAEAMATSASGVRSNIARARSTADTAHIRTVRWHLHRRCRTHQSRLLSRPLAHDEHGHRADRHRPNL